jgi:hypothetical protein
MTARALEIASQTLEYANNMRKFVGKIRAIIKDDPDMNCCEWSVAEIQKLIDYEMPDISDVQDD